MHTLLQNELLLFGQRFYSLVIYISSFVFMIHFVIQDSGEHHGLAEANIPHPASRIWLSRVKQSTVFLCAFQYNE